MRPRLIEVVVYTHILEIVPRITLIISALNLSSITLGVVSLSNLIWRYPPRNDGHRDRIGEISPNLI